MQNKIQALHQNASKFTMCFIRFWVKLNIFTMDKVINPLINMDQLLWTSELTNN
jgi:hypothetical protein